MTVYGSLGEIADERWEQVADRFDLGEVRRATPLHAGLFGKNVELDCASGRWVFRGAHADEVFLRERYFAELIAERTTLGAPWPYHIDASRELFDWSYSVMRHVGGESVTTHDVEDPIQVAAALGRAAAELHEVTFPAHGAFYGDRFVEVEMTQREWFEARAAAWVFMIASTEPLDAASERLVADAIATATVDGYTPTIVHHDLRVGNTNYRFDPVEVVGIYDLEETFVGDGDEDLARSLVDLGRRDPAAAAAFLRSYRERRPARAGEDARLRAYVLVDLLVLWEFGRRKDMPWFGPHERFEPWARERLGAVERVL